MRNKLPLVVALVASPACYADWSQSRTDGVEFDIDAVEDGRVWDGRFPTAAEPDQDWGFDPGAGLEPLAIDGARLGGSMGAQRNIAGAARRTEATSWGNSASVTVRAESTNWAAMAVVSIEGVRVHDLAIGTRIQTRSRVSGSEDQATVDVLGCSGEEDGIWDFDTHADTVELEVTEGSQPGWVRHTVRAHWDANGYGAFSHEEASDTVIEYEVAPRN